MTGQSPLTSKAICEGAACITVSGQWDGLKARRLEELVESLVESDHTSLVVDLARITDIDATALASLLELQKRADERDWHLVLVRPEEPLVRRLFEMTALDQRFVFKASRAAALVDAALARRPRLELVPG